MKRIYTLKCSSCKRFYLEFCRCRIQKTKKLKEKSIKQVELNLDKHCGVFSPSTNSFCLRSLKCKSHSVHLKRAVKGRSKPFDILLAEMKMNIIADFPANIDYDISLNAIVSTEEIMPFNAKLAYFVCDSLLKNCLTCRRPLNI